jgi:DNA-binding transcriptional LysR family regulator
MTLLTYQIFRTVAELGSFRKAADFLGLTPSAISHTISTMENELGFSVLTRNKSGVTLTNYGSNLLPYVNAVLNSDESLQQAVAQFNGLQQGKVKVGCFSSICTNWMPDIIRTFAKDYPGIKIEMFQGTYDDVTYWIKNGVVDFGFLSRSSAGDLQIEPLIEDPLLCVVPKDYEKDPSSPYMTIEEMSHQQFVVQRESTDADVQNYLRQNDLHVQTNYHVVDDLSTIALVAAGFGICITPEMAMHSIPYEVHSYRMDPPASRIVGIAALRTDLMAPAVRSLYDYIIKTYRK